MRLKKIIQRYARSCTPQLLFIVNARYIFSWSIRNLTVKNKISCIVEFNSNSIFIVDTYVFYHTWKLVYKKEFEMVKGL